MLFSDAKKRARLLAMNGDEGDETVAATWALSFSQVRQGDPAGAALLNVLGYLAADPIPRTLPWAVGPADSEGNGEGGEPGASPDRPAEPTASPPIRWQRWRILMTWRWTRRSGCCTDSA